MTSDAELLQQYSKDSSEMAFAELVQRHLGLVYGAALRQVGDAHIAEEITQVVFVLLAKKAGSLLRHPVLEGWLHTTTRLTALQAIKTMRRRQRQEQEFSVMEKILADESPSVGWDRLRFVIDEVLGELEETDRQAILLRFFSERTFGDVGDALRLTEDAARKRVQRALDKLHAALARRGIVSTGAALSLALAGQAATAAPAGLAAAAVSAALSGVGTATLAAGGGIAAATTFMTSFKVQLGIAAAIVAAGTSGVLVQSQANAALRNEISDLRRSAHSLEELRQQNKILADAADEVRTLRADDTELGQLHDEINRVSSSQQEAARAETNAELAREARIAQQPVYSEKDVDEQAKPLSRAKPVYPRELRRKNITGSAELSFIVAADGSVASLGAVKSTEPEFARAAMEALHKWRFAPAKKAGQPVNVRTQMTMSFTIAENGPPVLEQMQQQLAQRWF